ncbi:uncharacterized protein A1O5_00213 [Cladophialophora psammophila CBS 110553]|uniref:Uncharacterized protein n=1 Tax=Cladophialophora psammophila CBS 110553 TaxID=1182543 RepID=W9XFI4_9EURO|nr:uncharacterized protein A1O5_00213 [Cladophialophora psammophila CBS 110553]EXJ75706.1 hypothetical protein A1O5_00213 [Cladophialophora psammophila CBS 110553]
MFEFIHPTGVPARTSAWQTLSDQVHSASALLQSGTIDRAEATLDRFFHGLRQAAKHLDPSFLAKFWRICLGIKSIDGRIPGGGCLKRFFDSLIGTILEHNGQRHPLAVLVTAIRNVSPTELMNTLRLGFWMSIKVLKQFIGDENTMVLHMWSVFYRYWNERRDPAGFLWKFWYIRSKYSNGQLYNAETAITLSYYHAYAAYYVCRQRELARPIVMSLFQDAKEEVGRMATKGDVHWSLVTQALAFSARAVAYFHYERHEMSWSHGAMDIAIALLQTGDEECRIRAATLSKMLLAWLKNTKNTPFSAPQEKVQTFQEVPEVFTEGPSYLMKMLRSTAREISGNYNHLMTAK